MRKRRSRGPKALRVWAGVRICPNLGPDGAMIRRWGRGNGPGGVLSPDGRRLVSRLGEAADVNEVWKKFLSHLPLCAAEGGGVTEVAAGELERLIEEDSDCPRATVALVQEIFCRAGLLEPARAREGVWRFVSYPAWLFACSLLSS